MPMLERRKLQAALLTSVAVLLAAQACAGGRVPPTPTAIPLAQGAAPTVTLAGAVQTAAPGAQATKSSPGTTLPTSTATISAGSPNPSPSAPAPPSAIATEPSHIMALGNRNTVTLHSLPGTAGPVAAVVPGSSVLWVEARTADSSWLQVVADADGSQGWAARTELALLGDAERLPIVAPDPLAVTARSPAESSRDLSGKVTADLLNVRLGPGTDEPLLGQLHADDTITAQGRTNDSSWIGIAWEAGTAWVAAQWVQLNVAVSELPAVAQSINRPTPAISDLQGHIALQARTGGDLWVMKADGSSLRRLTDGMDPALSPDGALLAFARWGSPHGVFVLDLTTGDEQRVATANRPRSPTWSPDGTDLVFSHHIGSYTCLATPFGCVGEDLIRDWLGDEECMDTPLGRFCISDFERREIDEYGLARVAVPGGAWLDLPSDRAAESPQYHPSSGAIIYRGAAGLQIITPGGETRPLADQPDLGSPAWAPDGQHIVAQRHVHDHVDLFLLDSNGALLQALTKPPASGRAPNNVAPAWSPQGRFIVFLTDRDGSWQLYRMNADGSGQVPLLPATLSEITIEYDFAAERVVSWGR